MESAHAEAAVLLIEAGADRGRVRASCHLTQFPDLSSREMVITDQR
jgi:hypothetical protein